MMSEMTFINYIKIKNRMAGGYSYRCEISCRDCPLSSDNNGIRICCRDFERKYPKEAMAIVEKWNEEHPIVTNLQHYAEELRKVGFEVDEKLLKVKCPIPYSRCYSNPLICKNKSKMDCIDCKKWWNEEYVPTKESEKGE